MLPPKTTFAATALLASLAMPAMAVANTLIVPFTLTVASPAVLTMGDETGFTSTPFAQFDPANGTLTGIDLSLSGKGTWDTKGGPVDYLEARLTLPGDSSVTSANVQDIAPPGVIDLSLTADYAGNLLSTVLTGSGSLTETLDLFTFGLNETFSTVSPLAGSITYIYTPSVAVPEPASLVLFAGGLAILVIATRVARRCPGSVNEKRMAMSPADPHPSPC
jgi:hypothetical protein